MFRTYTRQNEALCDYKVVEGGNMIEEIIHNVFTVRYISAVLEVL